MNHKIEHTILKADTSEKEIKKLCNEAISHNLFAVCVPPYFIKSAKKYLKESTVKVVTVIGFPLGYSTTPAKVEEARKAIDEDVDEVDMVLNIAALKDGDLSYVANDIQSVATLVQLKGKKLKVIIETALLSQKEKTRACKICAEVNVDFVKTSTGFSSEGATVEDIVLMRSKLPKHIKIKASGGIKTKEQAVALIAVGADRIGTSRGPDLL